MSDHSFFEHLFKHSEQVTPYLKGAIKPTAEDIHNPSFIHIERSSSDTIQALYQGLKQAHPEAGAAYWLTRTWTLLCWQPIYVAFVAIYACQGLPKLASMCQQIQPTFISGYQFESEDYFTGAERELIEHAGKELTTLFDYYRQEMSEWTRIRPGFTHHLFADGVLGCLVKLSKLAPQRSEDELLQQARYWLSACDLSDKFLATLSYNRNSKQLQLVRTSCCLVYKCHGRALCGDCPRHPDNKR